MPDEIEQRLAAKEQALTHSADPRGGFRFAGTFFNNVRTDLAVGQQIGTVTQRLDAMDAERRQLLTQ